MLHKMFKVLLMTGVIAVFTTAPQAAQAADQEEVNASRQEEPSIVGSWAGTIDDGARILMSFTSDGIVLSSVQTEVSLTNPVLTPGHGAWTPVGRRQFALTIVAARYDIQTGEYLGVGKLRALLKLDRAGRLNGDKKAEFFDPNGSLLGTLAGAIRFTRITVEPFD
jgi:hypothetical protein